MYQYLKNKVFNLKLLLAIFVISYFVTFYIFMTSDDKIILGITQFINTLSSFAIGVLASAIFIIISSLPG